MKKLTLHESWLNELLPDGLSYPSSTLISGPGGSGKPLIGFAFVYDWLKSGGNVVFIALQYPETKFIKTSLQRLYDLNVDKYPKRVAYIQFDYHIDTWEKLSENALKANILKPDVWETAISEVENFLADGSNLGTLVFASALNLLLFAPSYKKVNLDKFEKLLTEDKRRTYIFSVSTSAFGGDIKRWEKATDNLMFARMEEPMQLYLRIEKRENREVSLKEVTVPIDKEILKEIKQIAESARKRDIPELQKI